MDDGVIAWAEMNIRRQPLEVIQRLQPHLIAEDAREAAAAWALTAAAWVSARDLTKGEIHAQEVVQRLKECPVDAKAAKVLGRAYLVLAEVNHDRGNSDACEDFMLLCRQQLVVALSPGLQGALHLLEAAVSRKKADVDGVRMALESALVAFDEGGDRAAVAGTMNNLAVLHQAFQCRRGEIAPPGQHFLYGGFPNGVALGFFHECIHLHADHFPHQIRRILSGHCHYLNAGIGCPCNRNNIQSVAAG